MPGDSFLPATEPVSNGRSCVCFEKDESELTPAGIAIGVFLPDPAASHRGLEPDYERPAGKTRTE